ncbi:hypothetical protein PV341_31965 [Streptomyces sp. PA03-1a]|nr:hypothetical protein [Streptomyces sp. PA03-1a]
MNLKNISGKFGMAVAVGAVVLTATPSATAAPSAIPKPLGAWRFKARITALTARQDDTVTGKKADKAIVAVATSKIVIVARVDESAAPQALRKLQTYAAENAS